MTVADIKPGFYWVRSAGSDWEVARVDGGAVFCMDDGIANSPSGFEIGPRVEPPGLVTGDGPIAGPAAAPLHPAAGRYVAIRYSETTPDQRARPETRVLFWCEDEEHARSEAALWNAGRAERAVQGVRDDYEWAILDTRPDLLPNAAAPLVGARVAVGPYGAGPSPALAVASSGR